VTADEFGSIYEQLAPPTITFLAVRFQDEDVAQDAVQQAALYLMERLDRYDTITPSYFKQLSTNRALDILSRGQGHRVTHGLKPCIAMGNWFDVARVEDPQTTYDGKDLDLGRCMDEART